MTARVVIADDHAILREGLKGIIASAGDLQLVGEAADGNGVMQQVRELDFDVLVLDLSMPGRSGIDLIRWVHAERPRLRILVLSMHQEQQYAVRTIRAGASGYLTKESAPDQLVQAIRKIAAGGAFVTAEVAEQLALGAMPGHALAMHEVLSNREFEVLSLLASGISVTNIADRLHLSVKTVSTHKANLMRKMGWQNQSELLRYALHNGLVDQADLS